MPYRQYSIGLCIICGTLQFYLLTFVVVCTNVDVYVCYVL